jgi:hypothetical protein
LLAWKKVLEALEQFIQMLHAHKAMGAFAKYDGTYGFQFYHIPRHEDYS